MISKQRILYLDVLRVLACCMIVLMHSPHPEAGNSGLLIVPLGFLTEPGIGIFFMVSGALLLPVQIPTFDFLKKRMGKIVGPTLFWTIFYLCVSWRFYGVPLCEIGKAAVSIPFSKQGHGVLWFMYTLAGLYLLSPVFSAFLKQATKQEVRFYLFLWGITLLYPWFRGTVITDESPTGILYYFAGYSGYFLLGYYLHTYKPKVPTMFSLLMIASPIVALAAYEFTGHEGWLSSGRFGYLSIFIAMMCVGWYALVQIKFDPVRTLNTIDSGSPKTGRGQLLRILSDCGFGIYLVHIFVMHHVIWNVDFVVHGFLGGIGQIILTWLSTFVASFILTQGISYLPYSEYIIGFSNRHK